MRRIGIALAALALAAAAGIGFARRRASSVAQPPETRAAAHSDAQRAELDSAAQLELAAARVAALESTRAAGADAASSAPRSARVRVQARARAGLELAREALRVYRIDADATRPATRSSCYRELDAWLAEHAQSLPLAADGSLELERPAQRVRLLARCEDLLGELELRPECPEYCEWTLASDGSVWVEIRDSSGAPVSAAQMSLRDPASPAAPVAPLSAPEEPPGSGCYRLEHLAASLRSPDAATRVLELTPLLPGEPWRFELRRSDLGALPVRCALADSSALELSFSAAWPELAQLRLDSAEKPRAWAATVKTSNRTRLAPLRGGSHYALSARSAACFGATPELELALEAGATTRVEIPFEARAVLRGRALDSNRKPLANAQLVALGRAPGSVDPSDAWNARTQTSGSGAFELCFLSLAAQALPLSYELLCAGAHCEQRFPKGIASGTTELGELIFERAELVASGRVLTRSGEPRPSVAIRATALLEGQPTATHVDVQSLEDGSFRVWSLDPAPRWRLTNESAREPAASALDVARGASGLELLAQLPARVRARVLCEADENFLHYRVVDDRDQVVDRGGLPSAFCSEDLEAGAYRFEVVAPSDPPVWSAAMKLVEGATHDLGTIDLRGRLAKLEVCVKDGHGQALVARVELLGSRESAGALRDGEPAPFWIGETSEASTDRATGCAVLWSAAPRADLLVGRQGYGSRLLRGVSGRIDVVLVESELLELQIAVDSAWPAPPDELLVEFAPLDAQAWPADAPEQPLGMAGLRPGASLAVPVPGPGRYAAVWSWLEQLPAQDGMRVRRHPVPDVAGFPAEFRQGQRNLVRLSAAALEAARPQADAAASPPPR